MVWYSRLNDMISHLLREKSEVSKENFALGFIQLRCFKFDIKDYIGNSCMYILSHSNLWMILPDIDFNLVVCM